MMGIEIKIVRRIKRGYMQGNVAADRLRRLNSCKSGSLRLTSFIVELPLGSDWAAVP